MTNNRRTYDIIILGETTEAISAALAATKLNLHVAIVGDVETSQQSPAVEIMFNQKLALAGVDTYRENACFLNSNIIIAGDYLLHGEKIIIATGSIAHRPTSFSFDGQQVIDVDEAISMQTLPQSIILVGDDQSGLQAAQRFINRGVDVTLVAPSCPAALRSLITFKKGEVIGAEVINNEVKLQLDDGELMTTEMVVVNVGRVGNTESLNLSAADLMADDKGKLWCNSEYQTWEANIFGLGDVAGVWNQEEDLQTIIMQILAPAEVRKLVATVS